MSALMATYGEYNIARLREFRDGLGPQLQKTGTLSEAAEILVGSLMQEFPDSTVLARVYATVPLEQLPPANRAFVERLVGAEARHLLRPDTPVLSLVGTRGLQASWNDRRASKGHVGIPLLNPAFVEEIPMVARLMHDLGCGLDWLATADRSLLVQSIGRVSGVFYVSDARSDVDARNRKIVPAQDFVQAHGVRTVFGIGGAYMDGTFVAVVIFTKEQLSENQVRIFMPLINVMKSATVGSVLNGAIFDRLPGAAKQRDTRTPTKRR